MQDYRCHPIVVLMAQFRAAIAGDDRHPNTYYEASRFSTHPCVDSKQREAL
jgi:hypothetical protein